MKNFTKYSKSSKNLKFFEKCDIIKYTLKYPNMGNLGGIQMMAMPQNVDVRIDEKGFVWKVNLKKSSRYPNGRIHRLVLESGWGSTTTLRYDEAGGFIDGNPALA